MIEQIHLVLLNGCYPISKNKILGASCHNTDEIKKALILGVDYIFISPIKENLKANKVLGWKGFQNICQQIDIPVFALGGVPVPSVAHRAFLEERLDQLLDVGDLIGAPRVARAFGAAVRRRPSWRPSACRGVHSSA